MALIAAMQARLLGHAPLTALLGGGHVYLEAPRGAPASFIAFGSSETRDWSVADQQAHEHFVGIAVHTNSRSPGLAQTLCEAASAALDGADLTLAGHRLVNLRLVFWSVARERDGKSFGAALRFRAATEPL